MNVANSVFYFSWHIYVHFYGLLTNYANFPLVRGYGRGQGERVLLEEEGDLSMTCR